MIAFSTLCSAAPPNGTPANTLPFSFPPPDAPIRSIHLRNIAWWQSRTFDDLHEIAIGLSHEDLLTQSVIVSLLRATPRIERLKLLAFERTDIPQPTHSLPKGFRLDRLHSLAASPVVLRTALVGFDSPDTAVSPLWPMSPYNSTLRKRGGRSKIPTVPGEKRTYEGGMFLRRHFTTALKLRGLDEGYV